MKRVIYTEFIKIRRNPVWLAFFILPVIPAIIGTFNYIANIGILKNGWYSLWTQHTLFFCYFFMPAIVGVYCSFLWRMEHFGYNWNQIMVICRPWEIVAGKLFMSSFLTCLTLVWVCVLYLGSGRLAGVAGEIPSELAEWILCGMAGGIVISAVQVFFSLVIRSFAVPVGISLAGGIAGLMATSKGVWYAVLYSLLSIGMRANNPNMDINIGLFLIVSFVYVMVLFGAGVVYLKKADVKTG